METSICKAEFNRVDNGMQAVIYDKNDSKYLGEVIIYAKFPEEFDFYHAVKNIVYAAETVDSMFIEFEKFSKFWGAVVQTRRNFSTR